MHPAIGALWALTVLLKEAVQLLKVIRAPSMGARILTRRVSPRAEPEGSLDIEKSMDSSQTLRLWLRARFTRLGITDRGN